MTTDHEHRVTLGELEADCEDLIADVQDGTVYAIVDEDDEPLAIMIPYSMYEEIRGESDLE